MLVKDVMTRNPVTISPEASVVEATNLMKLKKIGKLVVVDKSGALAGIITKGDLSNAAPSSATTLDVYELSYLLSKLTVEKTMVRSVKTTSPSQTIEEAARLMNDYGINCLPVLEGNVIVGIITQTDLFNCFTRLFSTQYAGVRCELLLDEKPGQLAKLTSLVAEKNGNIVSVVTSDTDVSGKRMLTVKAVGISLGEMREIVMQAGGETEDIRLV